MPYAHENMNRDIIRAGWGVVVYLACSTPANKKTPKRMSSRIAPDIKRPRDSLGSTFLSANPIP